jgi:hypothetical protein
MLGGRMPHSPIDANSESEQAPLEWILHDLETTISDASPEELSRLHSKLWALSEGITERFHQQLEAKTTETAKAYGGCTKCYGKGFSTWRHGETYRGVTRNIRNDIKYCICDRGKQLKALLEANIAEARLVAKIEAAREILEYRSYKIGVGAKPILMPLGECRRFVDELDFECLIAGWEYERAHLTNQTKDKETV